MSNGDEIRTPTELEDWDEAFERECGYLPDDSTLPSLRRAQLIAVLTEKFRRQYAECRQLGTGKTFRFYF